MVFDDDGKEVDGLPCQACPQGTWSKNWELRERGVKVTVSTDDPPFFHTSMADEYEALAKTFGWDEEVFDEIARTSVEAAFCDADTKAALLKRLG